MVNGSNEKLVCFMTCTCITLLFLLVISNQYITYLDYDEYDCNITRVEYPTIMPTYNDSQGWISCNCGYRCTSLTTCIKLYSSVKPELMIQNELFDNMPCTFIDINCIKNEDPREISSELTNAINLAEQYINTTVNCYYDEYITNIYLEIEIKEEIIVMVFLIIGIYICCGVGLFVSFIKSHRNK